MFCIEYEATDLTLILYVFIEPWRSPLPSKWRSPLPSKIEISHEVDQQAVVYM